MKRIVIWAAGAGLLALAACNRADEPATDAGLNNDMALNEADANAMAAAVPASASEFVDKAAASDLYEIEAGKLAAEKASDAAIKSFGQMLSADHAKSSADLKAAAAKAEPAVTPPTALPADKQAKVDALKAASGAEFDRLFVEQQIEAHSQALELLNSYAAGGDSQPLKEFAAKTAPVIQAHLDRALSLKK